MLISGLHTHVCTPASCVPTLHPHEQTHSHIPQAHIYTKEVRAGEMPQSVNCVSCKKKERVEFDTQNLYLLHNSQVQ